MKQQRMNFNYAKEIAKKGRKIRSVRMNPNEYVVWEKAGFKLKAKDIWNEANKLEALKAPNGELEVLSYFIHFNGIALQMGLDYLPLHMVNSDWVEVN